MDIQNSYYLLLLFKIISIKTGRKIKAVVFRQNIYPTHF